MRMKIILAMRSNAAASKPAGNAAAAGCGVNVVVGLQPGDPLACGAPALNCMPLGVAIRGVAEPRAKRAITKRIATNAATASKASMMKLANSAPMPRWLIRAASPSPAARPAIGPIHERLGAAAAPAAAGVPGVACAGLAGTAAGGVRAGRLRFMPE